MHICPLPPPASPPPPPPVPGLEAPRGVVGGAVPKDPSLLASGAEARPAAAAGPAVWSRRQQSPKGGGGSVTLTSHMCRCRTQPSAPHSRASLSSWDHGQRAQPSARLRVIVLSALPVCEDLFSLTLPAGMATPPLLHVSRSCVPSHRQALPTAPSESSSCREARWGPFAVRAGDEQLLLGPPRRWGPFAAECLGEGGRGSALPWPGEA